MGSGASQPEAPTQNWASQRRSQLDPLPDELFPGANEPELSGLAKHVYRKRQSVAKSLARLSQQISGIPPPPEPSFWTKKLDVKDDEINKLNEKIDKLKNEKKEVEKEKAKLKRQLERIGVLEGEVAQLQEERDTTVAEFKQQVEQLSAANTALEGTLSETVGNLRQFELYEYEQRTRLEGEKEELCLNMDDLGATMAKQIGALREENEQLSLEMSRRVDDLNNQLLASKVDSDRIAAHRDHFIKENDLLRKRLPPKMRYPFGDENHKSFGLPYKFHYFPTKNPPDDLGYVSTSPMVSPGGSLVFKKPPLGAFPLGSVPTREKPKVHPDEPRGRKSETSAPRTTDRDARSVSPSVGEDRPRTSRHE